MQRITSLSLVTIVSLYGSNSPVMETIEIKDQRNVVLEQKESATASMIVTNEEISRYGDLTPSDILKRLPGVSLPEGKGKGVSIRGLGKGYTKILIDGEELSGSMKDKIVQLDRIPTSLISRIEVSTNGQAQYASDAMGGVVNIILKEPMAKNSTTTKIQTGEVAGKQTKEVYVGHESQKGKLFTIYNLSYLQTADVTKQKKISSSTEHQEEVSYNNMVNFTPKATYKYNQYNTFGIDGFFSKSVGTDNKSVDISDNSTRQENTKDALSMMKSTFKWTKTTPQGSKLFASLFGYDILSSSIIQGHSTQTLYDDSSFRDVGYGSRGFFQTLHNESHLIKTGWELTSKEHKQKEYKTIDNIYQATPSGNTTIRETYQAFFIQDEMTFLDEKLITTPGIRFENVSMKGAFLPSGEVVNTYATPSFHVLYKLSPNDQIRASIAQSVKRPTFSEYSTYVDLVAGGNSLSNPDHTGNAAIKKETSWGMELKGEHYFEDKGIISVTTFYRTIDNKIENRVIESNSRWVSMPFNVSKAQTWGIEGDFKKRLDFMVEGLSLYTNGTWMGSRIEDENGITRPLANTPVYLLNGGVDQVIKPFNITSGFSFHHNGGFDRVTQANSIIATQKPTTTIDIYAIKKITNDFKAKLSVKNLFANESVTEQERLGSTELLIRSPQRTVMVSLEGKF